MASPTPEPTSTGSPLVLRLALAALIVAAAAVHWSVAADHGRMGGLFVLNALGYLALLGLLYLPAFRSTRWTTRRVLMGYAAVTLALFLTWGALSGEWRPLGFLAAGIELALIGLLWLDERRSGDEPPRRRPHAAAPSERAER
jgi:hypothetical protein